MPISQANIEWISKVGGVSVEELSGALSGEEVKSLDLKLNGKVYSQKDIEDLTTANENAYIQIGYKKVAKAAGIELEPGEKEADIVAGKIKKGLEVSLEEKYKDRTPSEEMQAILQDKIQFENKYNALKKTFDDKENELTQWEEKYSTLENTITNQKIDNEIKKYLKNPEDVGLGYDQQLALFKMERSVSVENEKFVPKKSDGEPVLNNVGEIETVENTVKGWLDTQSFTKKRKGMNGDDFEGGDQGHNFKSNDEAYEYMVKNNIEPMSDKGLELMKEVK